MTLIRRDTIRNNWYQRDSFFASSFALVSTRDKRGLVNVAPYQLTLPYSIDGNPQILLIARPGSATLENLRLTLEAGLNYIPWKDEYVQAMGMLGSPFVPKERKRSETPFTNRTDHPLWLNESIQVIDTTLDAFSVTERAAYVTLNVVDIHVDERWASEGVPEMPITYGARNGNQLWFSHPGKPFHIPFELE